MSGNGTERECRGNRDSEEVYWGNNRGSEGLVISLRTVIFLAQVVVRG